MAIYIHPANIMWVWSDAQYPAYSASAALNGNNPRGRSLLLDWEMVALGSGPQDVGQYLISHMNPATRREEEESLVRGYYHLLTAEECDDEQMKGKPVLDYTFEDCWRDYVFGGAERWLWFVPFLAVYGSDPMTQYFQDQTAAFLKDHHVTPDNIGMPRV